MFWYSKKFTSSRWSHMNWVIFRHKVSAACGVLTLWNPNSLDLEWVKLDFVNCLKPSPLFERGPNNHSREIGFYTHRSQEHRMSSTEHRSSAGTMLVQRLRRWPNIETALDRVIGVRAGTTSETMQGRRNAIAKPLCRVSARRHRRSLRETP